MFVKQKRSCNHHVTPSVLVSLAQRGSASTMHVIVRYLSLMDRNAVNVWSHKMTPRTPVSTECKSLRVEASSLPCRRPHRRACRRLTLADRTATQLIRLQQHVPTMNAFARLSLHKGLFAVNAGQRSIQPKPISWHRMSVFVRAKAFGNLL